MEISMMAMGMMMMTKMLMLLPLQTMTNTKRLLVYIVPVTVLSFSLNIPKFMEVVIIFQVHWSWNYVINHTQIHGCSLAQLFSSNPEVKKDTSPTQVTLTQNNGTNAVDPSQTRRDPTFIFWWVGGMVEMEMMIMIVMFILFISSLFQI